MNKIYQLVLFTIISPFLSTTMNAQAPIINAVTPLSAIVEKHGKFEATIALTANYTNPYDYDNIRISAAFVGPNGQSKTVDGFFMQDYQLTNPQTGTLAPIGSGAFKIRFSPDQEGLWTYAVSCTTSAGIATFPMQNFEATAIVSATNKGFVRADLSNYLHFDNEEQYIPIGENIGWGSYANFQTWLPNLRDGGGNFLRLWQCHWGWGLEWRNGNGYQGLKRYQQNNSFYLDQLFDFCNDNGLYVMYCLQHHGQVSSQVNPNWSESPYNTANGGTCANTWEFFTDATAKAVTKNRYRYVLARWGYARSVMAWELFNEVDWTDQFEQRSADVAAWHAEMAAFLKTTDPYQHLVTTSYAHDYNDATVWNSPDIDFTQTHHYANVPNLERILANSVGNYLSDFGKPTVNGEFSALVDNNGLSTLDPDGIHLHNCMWGSLFSGAMGTSMTWWWDNYVEPLDLYYHFEQINHFANSLPLREQNFMPTTSTVSGAPADLVLTPSQSWAALADTLLTIENGAVSPAGALLSQFLYGSSWNTQFRRPPVFVANFPQNGSFSVRTAGQTGTTPRIAIWLDGALVLDQEALVNQTYTIQVSAGEHQIKVDNTGTDWISISSYRLSDLGSAVDAYVLKSEDQLQLAGWLLNNSYNHDYVRNNGLPPSASGATVSIPDVANGTHLVQYYDCLTGALLSTETISVGNGTLILSPPEMLWDMAFVVAGDATAIAETHAGRKALPIQVYPNPVVTSAPTTVSFAMESDSPALLSLLDASGRSVQTLFEGALQAGAQQISVQTASELPAGLYWLKVEAGQQVGAQAIMVTGDRP